MYWYKVKSMLIVLFLLINIFLVSAIFYGYFNDRKTVREVNSATKTVLQKNGVTLKGEIPEDIGQIPSATLTAVFEKDSEQAKLLLQGDPTTSMYEDRGTLYMRGKRTLLVSGSYFEYDDKGESELAVIGQDEIKRTGELLRDLGIELRGADAHISGNKIIYKYHIEKRPLFNADLTVTPGKNGIKAMKGYALNAELGTGKVKIRPAAKAAVEFVQTRENNAEKECIVKIELGYSLFLGDTGVNFKSAEAIPTWRITFENGKYLYYDARNN